MSAIAAIFYREGKLRFTNLGWMFWDLFYPLGYLLVFSVGINYALGSPFQTLDLDYNAFFLAGVLGMASFGIASNTAWGFFFDRDNGIFYEMLIYPLSRAQFLAGKVLFNLLLAVAQAAIAVSLAAALLRVPIRWDLWPVLVVGVVGGTAGWFFFFAIFALKIRRNDVFNTVMSVFYFLLLFASSMFYPLEPLPVWFRTAALSNPITWQVDWLRFSTIGLGDMTQVMLEGLAFALFSLLAFAYAVRCLQQQE
ncbi:MAG: ABC transporter permease [Acidobacteria bacterium]|nr:ABC transporter permease [Acidobacteriota bacterium]